MGWWLFITNPSVTSDQTYSYGFFRLRALCCFFLDETAWTCSCEFSFHLMASWCTHGPPLCSLFYSLTLRSLRGEHLGELRDKAQSARHRANHGLTSGLIGTTGYCWDPANEHGCACCCLCKGDVSEVLVSFVSAVLLGIARTDSASRSRLQYLCV